MINLWLRAWLAVALLLMAQVIESAAADLSYNILEEVEEGSFIANVILDAKLDIRYPPNDLRLLHFSLHDKQGAQRNYKDLFHIGERDGVLKTAQRLDREQICARQLTCPIELNVMVQPGQFFEIIKVTVNVIDLNDNAPLFPQTLLEKAVSESAMPGAAFTIPAAEDGDSGSFGIQSYQLVTETNKFELQVTNNSLGSVNLQLILTSRIDREEEENFLMEIVAMDGGKPAKTGSMMVQISVLDANDNNPRFDNYSYEVMISENTPIGSTILQVLAHDPDQGLNGEVEYSFDPTTQAEYSSIFGIEDSTGEIFIKGDIDFETANVFHLTVMAQDKGSNSLPAYAKVTVRVRDMNDHAPHINVNALTSTGYVEVSETAQVGAFVAHVSVVDFDSGSSGEFDCHMASDHFQLQKLFPTEFKIVTTTTFDREFQSEYHLNMVCEDNGEPVRSAVEHIIVTILDANDHAPEFQHRIYTAEIRENNELGAFITQVVALDNDIGNNAVIHYSIADDDRELLTINENTGIVRANVKFDYETNHEIEFVVQAKDMGSPRRTARALLRLVIIDTNDEVPQFTQSSYVFHVLENVHEQTFVGVVSATDPDQPPYNQITYSLHPDYDGLRVFSINPVTGQMSTKMPLDREEQHLYHVMIVASNEGFIMMRTLVNVTVFVEDQNDNAPILDYPNEWNNTVHISKGTPVGAAVARIRAHDIDDGKNSALTFSIFDGNGENFFVMNLTTGIIYLSKKLETDGYQFHKMKVVVQDGGNPHKQAMGEFNIVVNKTKTLFGYQSSSFSFMNLKDSHIIVGAVILLFIILLLVLIIVVIKCRRSQTRRNNKYNCRREAKKRDTKKKDPRDSLEWKAVPNDYSGPDNYAPREVANCKEKPKKAVTFRVEITEGEGDQQSLWPTGSHCDLQKGPACRDSDATTSCDEDGYSSVDRYGGGVRRFPQPEPPEHYPLAASNHLNHTPGRNHNHNFPTLTKAELEMHEMLQLLHQDGDSETGSYTDSGRGPSEEGDNGTHTTPLDHPPADDGKASAAGSAVTDGAPADPSGVWNPRYPASSRPSGAPLRSFMPSTLPRPALKPTAAATTTATSGPPHPPPPPHKAAAASPSRHTLPRHHAPCSRPAPSPREEEEEPLWVPRTPVHMHTRPRDRCQGGHHPNGIADRTASLGRKTTRIGNPTVCPPSGKSDAEYIMLGGRLIEEDSPSDGETTTSGSYMIDSEDRDMGSKRDVTV